MAMSVTTQGDDDGSVDTLNTGDTPTASDGRLAHRKDSSVLSDLEMDMTPKASAAASAIAGGGGARGVGAPERSSTDEAVAAVVAATMAVATTTAVAAVAAAAGVGAGACAGGDGETKVPEDSNEVSPVLPTPPSADLKGVEVHAVSGSI